MLFTLTGFLPAAGCGWASPALETKGRKDRTVDTRLAPMPAMPVWACPLPLASAASSGGPSAAWEAAVSGTSSSASPLSCKDVGS